MNGLEALAISHKTGARYKFPLLSVSNPPSLSGWYKTTSNPALSHDTLIKEGWVVEVKPTKYWIDTSDDSACWCKEAYGNECGIRLESPVCTLVQKVQDAE